MDNKMNNQNQTSDKYMNTSSVSGTDKKFDKNISTQASAQKVSDKVNEVKDKIVQQAGPAVDYLKSNLSNVSERSQVYIQDASSLIRRYPFYSVLGAVAIGAFVGMSISRSSDRRS